MTTCTILDRKTVHQILTNLSKEDNYTFRNELAESLVQFSISGEREYQPEPTAVNRPDGRKILFRPFTSQNGPGIKIIVDPLAVRTFPQPPESTIKTEKPTLHGVLVLCDENGLPTGLINADEITGYRTSLSVMIPYLWRTRTANIVVFGAGKQALWHIRLALVFRGAEIQRITIVNRSQERSHSLVAAIQRENQRQWQYAVEFNIIGADQPDNESTIRRALDVADVIFCTTPSERPLFPAGFIAVEKRGCFISGVGSWQANMTEIDPILLRAAANSNLSGAVIVDDRQGAYKSSGEIIQSNLQDEQILELGDLINLSSLSPDEFSGKMSRRLADGLVIYKSVGVSMTDLATGNTLLSLARRQGLGLSLMEF